MLGMGPVVCIHLGERGRERERMGGRRVAACGGGGGGGGGGEQPTCGIRDHGAVFWGLSR